MIQEKIHAGEMKLAHIAHTLEELHRALENSITIETKIVLAKNDYEKRKALGG